MLVSDLAYRDMEARADSLYKRMAHLLGAVFRRSSPVSPRHRPYDLAPEHSAHLKLVPPARDDIAHRHDCASPASGEFRWRRHPQLLKRTGKSAKPDANDVERGARSAAVRGLFLARSGRFKDARTAFAVAAREPSVDLTAIPGFWDLPRTGMMAAVHAYEDARRFREASALGAWLRLRYRPRAIAALPDLPVRKESASGS